MITEKSKFQVKKYRRLQNSNTIQYLIKLDKYSKIFNIFKCNLFLNNLEMDSNDDFSYYDLNKKQLNC